MEVVEAPQACQISYPVNLKAEDFRGIRLSPDYRLAIQGQEDPDHAEASARNAADIFGRFHEMPLTKMPSCVEEVYRLTWVPSFHRTTTVRAWRSEDGYFIVIKRLERTPENRNGYAHTEKSRQISLREWEDLRQTIDNFDFWNIPSLEDEALVNDGAAWLLEGSAKARYHNVLRTLPDAGYERSIRKIFSLSQERTEIDLYLGADQADGSVVK